MNHSKGKWELIFQKFQYEPEEICLGVGVKTKEKGGVMVEMICNSMLPDTDEEYIKVHEQVVADMKLIAAAPYLLRSLDDIRQALIFENNPNNKGLIQITEQAIKEATL